MGDYFRILTGGRRKKETTAPKGHVVVYVSEGMKRHVVPIPFLQNPEFRQLLDQAADAYGFHGPGGRILLPCNEDTFARVLSCCTNHG